MRIGVYGEWGSGKSSVLHFVEGMARAEGHIIFSFNPWQYQSTDHLWKAFVEGLFSREQWLAVAAEQADFRIDTTIRATLPSGVAWIPCPPVACWTGHPSGEPVWCFHDDDLVEVRGDDPDTVRRMTEIAVRLGAEVLRWDGQPIRPVS